MLSALKARWPIYLIEACALGTFMVSAAFFAILLEHPDLPVRAAVPHPMLRRLLMGLAMGTTAILLIYSSWGKRSGAHMNPAVTLTFLQLDRIRPADAAWYILAQFAGGITAMLLVKGMLMDFISAREVNYVVTMPGKNGVFPALLLEAGMSFLLFLTVLSSSNSRRLAPYTGYLVGCLITLFITFEAPFSGMSLNPARTVASAFSSGMWTAWWLYFIGPIVGMQAAGWIYRRNYRRIHGGNCLTMDCHMSGEKHDNSTYEVLGPKELLGRLKTPV